MWSSTVNSKVKIIIIDWHSFEIRAKLLCFDIILERNHFKQDHGERQFYIRVYDNFGRVIRLVLIKASFQSKFHLPENWTAVQNVLHHSKSWSVLRGKCLLCGLVATFLIFTLDTVRIEMRNIPVCMELTIDPTL